MTTMDPKSQKAVAAAQVQKKMQELNPQSEPFRQWARAMRGYMGASRSRHAIEKARLKSVHLAGMEAWKDEGLNQMARETARLSRLSVHERRRLLNGK